MAAAEAINTFSQEMACQVLVSLKLGGTSVATEQADDTALVVRLAQAMLFSQAQPNVQYIFDTFMDVDRGYYPRHAFIDRRFNPRPAAYACAFLNAHLSRAQKIEVGECDQSRVAFSLDGQASSTSVR